MKNSETSATDPIRGLRLLMYAEDESLHPDDCWGYAKTHLDYPFELDMPGDTNGEIVFVGAHNVELTMEIFPTIIRRCIGRSRKDDKLHYLRVVSTLRPGTQDKQYVFFEVWIGQKIVISGETIDWDSNSDYSAHRRFEDVFAFLSQVYGVTIERVTAPAVPLKKLYCEECPT